MLVSCEKNIHYCLKYYHALVCLIVCEHAPLSYISTKVIKHVICKQCMKASHIKPSDIKELHRQTH